MPFCLLDKSKLMLLELTLIDLIILPFISVTIILFMFSPFIVNFPFDGFGYNLILFSTILDTVVAFSILTKSVIMNTVDYLKIINAKIC